jgi:hypothetical protein
MQFAQISGPGFGNNRGHLMSTVVGLFESWEQARRAVAALEAAGIPADQMGLIARERRDAEGLADDVEVESDRATAAGVLGGGALGALGGLLAGAGVLAIPGIGPVLAIGPVVGGVAGGLAGATTGGLVGSLIDWGVPEHEARHYHAGVERGGILLTVRAPEGREDEVRALLGRVGMRGVDEHRRRWESDPDFRYSDTHRSE